MQVATLQYAAQGRASTSARELRPHRSPCVYATFRACLSNPLLSFLHGTHFISIACTFLLTDNRMHFIIGLSD